MDQLSSAYVLGGGKQTSAVRVTQQEGAGLGSGSHLASAEPVRTNGAGNIWVSLETFVLWLTQVPKALAESPGQG